MSGYKFEDAEYVKMEGGGRTAEPNPFTEVIAAIALKTKDGKPVAKSFIETHDAGDDKRTTAVNRIKRFTSEAGEKNDPAVTVRVHATPVVTGQDKNGKVILSPTQTKVTIWTLKRQTRPKKDTATQTASTPQSTAPATPDKK